jgi:hypothetical protein
VTPEQIKGLFDKPYSRLVILGIVGILVAVGMLFGNRLQQDKHTQNKVLAWKSKYNYLIVDLTNDFKKAQTATQANDVQQLSTICGQIKKDSVKAESSPVVPDPNIETNWKAGLKDDADGGEMCQKADSDSSSAEFTTASNDFTAGTKALSAATKQLQAVKQ